MDISSTPISKLCWPIYLHTYILKHLICWKSLYLMECFLMIDQNEDILNLAKFHLFLTLWYSNSMKSVLKKVKEV